MKINNENPSVRSTIDLATRAKPQTAPSRTTLR